LHIPQQIVTDNHAVDWYWIVGI